MFAALVLALLLAAGYGGDDPSPTSTATPTATATAESSQATPTATATPASTATAESSRATPTATATPTSTATAAPSTATPASTPTEGSTPTTPSPTPARSPALTVEEYAQWCAASQPTPASDVTPAEAVAEALAEIERIEPPPELHGFHTALTGNGIALLLLFRELEEGGLAEGEDTLDGLSFVAGLFDRAFEREVAALPEGVRATLEEASCLWGNEFTDAVAGPTPGPTSVAREDPAQGVTDSPQSWDTLGQVIARGELKCGVKQTQPLFGFRAADGTYSGFDIEFCKAIAAAVLGDNRRVEYIDASDPSTRFELLAVAEIDVLIRATAVTASRDRELGVDFAQPIFYTGQGFAVRKDSGIQSTSDMGDATICVRTGTTTEQNLADHFTDIGLDPMGGFDHDGADAFFYGRDHVRASVPLSRNRPAALVPSPARLHGGPALAGEHEDVLVAGRPGDGELAAADTPAVLRTDEGVGVIAAQREGVVALGVGEVVLGLHVGDAGGLVAIDRDDVIGADVLGRRKAAETGAHARGPVVGAHGRRLAAAPRGEVDLDLVGEAGAVGLPIPHVDARGVADDSVADGLAIEDLLDGGFVRFLTHVGTPW